MLALLVTVVVAACSGGGGQATHTATEPPTATPTETATEGTIAVPDIVGETEQDGLVTLGAAGLTAGSRSRRYSDDIDQGHIIRTDPRAGVIVARGTAVDYVVSRGPEPTPSPTPRRTAKPTSKPTPEPTQRPTPKPTPTQTGRPTEAPTARPTATPTERPTEAPTQRPTEVPTARPTVPPTEPPTTGPSEPPPATMVPGTLPLPGSAWVLVMTAEDVSTDVPLPSGLVFTADFGETDVSGTVVCNRFSAPYTAEPDGRLTVGEVAVTTEACPDDDGTAQAGYLAALRASTRYHATATRLLLTSDEGTRLVYVPVIPTGSPSASPSTAP